jgi:hypothetical protein
VVEPINAYEEEHNQNIDRLQEVVQGLGLDKVVQDL